MSLTDIAWGVIILSTIIMVLLFGLSKMGLLVDKECERQLKPCFDAGGTPSYVECNCHPTIFSNTDCKACWESAGSYCYYPNGSQIKCQVNLTS